MDYGITIHREISDKRDGWTYSTKTEMSKKQHHKRHGAHHAKARRQHELEERERRRAQRTNTAKRIEFFSEDL